MKPLRLVWKCQWLNGLKSTCTPASSVYLTSSFFSFSVWWSPLNSPTIRWVLMNQMATYSPSLWKFFCWRRTRACSPRTQCWKLTTVTCQVSRACYLRFCSLSWPSFHTLIHKNKRSREVTSILQICYFPCDQREIILVIMSIVNINGEKKITKNCLNRNKKDYEEIRFHWVSIVRDLYLQFDFLY